VSNGAKRDERVPRGLPAGSASDATDSDAVEINPGIAAHVLDIVERIFDKSRHRAVVPRRGNDHAVAAPKRFDQTLRSFRPVRIAGIVHPQIQLRA
jgi:hypothetical protein